MMPPIHISFRLERLSKQALCLKSEEEMLLRARTAKRTRTSNARTAAKLSHCIESLEMRRMLSGSWTTVATPVPASDGAQMAMLLTDGSVMVHGGGGANSAAWYKLTPKGISYAAGGWSTLLPMSKPRLFFGSNILPNGKVMVLGGEYTGPNTTPATVTDDNTGEIYDPTTNTWSPMATFPQSQFGDDPTEVLPDGRVLGGYISGSATYFYNPTTNSWAPNVALKLNLDNSSDEESWVKLPDGSILSYDIYGSLNNGVPSAQKYVPSLGQWVSAGTLPALLSTSAVALELGPAFLLPDGRVFFVGGNNNTAYYTPSTNTWTAGPALPSGLVGADVPGAMMPNGHILLALSPLGTLNAKGNYSFPPPTRVYEFDPVANTYTDLTSTIPSTFVLSNRSAFSTTMLVLPSGQVMMMNDSGTIALFTPNEQPSDAWRPKITDITNDTGSNVFTITGMQLNGLSEGAAYGDDNEMASNYPIVKFSDQFGTEAYGRTFNWSSNGVATGGAFETVQCTLPPGFAPGVYLVTVIANGIQSNQVLNVQLGAFTTSSITLQPNSQSVTVVDVAGGGTIKASFSLGLFDTTIVSGDAAADTVIDNENFAGRTTIIHGGDGADLIRLETNGSGTVVEDGGNGNDSFELSTTGGNLSNIASFVIIEGGAGFDTVSVFDSNNASNNTYTINTFNLTRPGFGGLTYDSAIEAIGLTTGNGADVVNIPSNAIATTLNSHGGNDTVNLGSAGSVQNILGDVNVNNTPAFSTINVDDSADAIARTFITLENGNLFGLAPGAINWVPGDVNAITISTGTGGNTYFVHGGSSSFFTTLNTGFGDDTVVFESDAPGLFTINGQAGNDGVSIFDSSAIAQTYQITSAGLSRSGLTVNINLVETLALAAGDAADAINFSTSIQYALNIDGGGGNDTFTVGSASQAQFLSSVVLTGGAGDDNFIWKNASNNWFQTSFGRSTASISIDGGIGFNQFAIDDTTRGNTSYQFYADRFFSDEPVAFEDGADVTYHHMGAVGLTASNGNNALSVFSTSSDVAPGNQDTINLNGGNDTATLFPHDAAGNLTINGIIGIVGGAGTDAMVFSDTGATGGINYDFSNPFGSGTQDVFGLGLAGMGYTSDFESATINAGDGNDTFTIDQYKTTTTPLTILGAGGNDLLTFMPTSKDLVNNFGTGNNVFSFTGGSGSDTMSIRNDNSTTEGITYSVNNSQLNMSNQIGSAALAVFISDSSVETINLTGGQKTDVFLITATQSGSAYNLSGGPGAVNDSYALGQPLSPSIVTGILGPINIDGSGGGVDDVTIYDNSETVGRTVDIANNFVGAASGDNLFGAGGYLHYTALGSLTINLGSGADTVYAQPDSLTPITIAGNNPTTAPGDRLFLALATAINPVITHSTSTSGFVTSGNLKKLTYSGFETGPTADTVAPFVTGAIFDWTDSQQDLKFTFSEQLVGDPGAASIQLLNESTGATGSAGMTETYNSAALTVTFSFAPGALPAGIYQATLPAGNFRDTTGNPLPADFVYTFLWVPSSGALALSPGSGAVRVQQIAIGSGGSFDVSDNAVVLDYTGTSPLPAIRTYLATGFNQGAWNGAGINSSIAHNDPLAGHALGYAENSDLQFANFLGIPVDNTAILIRYTPYGDNNLDGVVDIGNDFNLLLDGLAAASGNSWVNGDYTYDGNVDLGNDFNLFLTSYLRSNQPPAAAPPSAVPAVVMFSESPTAPSLLAGMPTPSLFENSVVVTVFSSDDAGLFQDDRSA
jgi:hypothetical protein